jgi:Rrf2 family protein
MLINLAGRKEKGFVPVEELGGALRVSKVFLSKIVQTLARSGVLESSRGRVGGVRLREGKVTLWQVISIMDPGFTLNRCLKKYFACFLKTKCPLHRWLKDFEDELQAKMNAVYLSQLANERR